MTVLEVETRTDCTLKGALDALIAGCTAWARDTAEGKRAWEASSEDFNVGDLMSKLPDADE